MQFHKLYESTWVVTTDFCSMNLVEGEANGTPRDTIFIYDPFHEASYRENSNEIKYPLRFVEDCCYLMSQPFLKINFVVVDVPQAPSKDLTGYYAIIFAIANCRVLVFKN